MTHTATRRTARKAPAPPPVQPLRLPRRMAATDALFWYAESALPIFRPIIAGLYVLDRTPSRERMLRGLDYALALVPRLRERVVETPLHLALPEWVEDPHFDVSYHVRHISLPPPGSERELLDLSATLFAGPLDRERPLWEAYWMDGLSRGRAAFLFKLHHSVVDGVGAIALINGLTQSTRNGPLPRIERMPAPRPPAAPAPRVADAVADGAAAALRAASGALGGSLRALAAPLDSAAQLARTARGVRATIADLLAPPPRDPLAAHCAGLSRRFDALRIPLARLQRIKAPLGVTINDVVLTAVAGALGAYHRARHVRAAELNCMVPMNLRGKDERDALGNRVGTFTVRLPLAERSAARRLARIVAQTRAAKSDRRGAAAPMLFDAIALLPGFALRWMARQSLGKINVACTNIPGVAETRYMAGARVDAIYPFASVVEGTPLVIALLSYAGVMHVGIDTDPEAIPDPARLHAMLDAALTELERLGANGAARPLARAS